jgi:hypothetical protein
MAKPLAHGRGESPPKTHKNKNKRAKPPHMSYHVSSLAMRQARSQRRNHNSVRFVANTSRLGPISNVLTLAVILAIMGLLFLTQVTKTNTYSYQVSELEQQKAALIEEKQNLEVESARLQALERIKTSDVAKRLSDPKTVEFVQ